MTRFALALCVLALGCTAVADFPEGKLAESTPGLCQNGMDDDEDGLIDCQDWKCLAHEVCCTAPSIVLEDAFDAPGCTAAACGAERPDCAPSEVRWQAWGTPFPRVCDGALLANKERALCYPVGILGRVPIELRPGLEITVRVSGVPEPAGRFDVGLTLDDVVSGASDECAIIARVSTIVSATYASSGAPGGVRVVGSLEGVPFDDRVLDAAASAHEIKLSIGADRRVRISADGAAEMIAPDEALPEGGVTARLVLHGVGYAARVEHVRVVVGTQCDSPKQWVAATPFVTLGRAESAWDDFDQSQPNVGREQTGLALYYSGCRRGSGAICDPLVTGIGRAAEAAAGGFSRPAQPLLQHESRQPLDLLIADGRGYFGTEDGHEQIEQFEVADGVPIAGSFTSAFSVGADDAWNGDRLCCPSVLIRGDERLLYFAARGQGDPTWRIGVATSQGGKPFKAELAPILSEGESGQFDDRGVSEPTVIFARGLYRMWYTAHARFGRTSIGYAVSDDGIIWHKYPDNPVITPDVQGGPGLPAPPDLASVGGPAAVAEDGRFRLWIHGKLPGDAGRQIFELENRGKRFGE